MSDEHKAALARGRQESRAVKAYLQAFKSGKNARAISKESLNKNLSRLEDKLMSADNPLEAVELIQSKLNVEHALAELNDSVDIATLEAEFIKYAGSYSQR